MEYIVIISIVLLIVSMFLGILVLEFTKLRESNHLFATPIGFIVLLAILQLCYYPIELFSLKTSYLEGITYIVILLICFLSFIFKRKIINHFKVLKNNSSLVFLGIIFFTITIIVLYNIQLPLRTNDGQFYFDMINSKSQMEYLTFDNISYKFQGFYDFCVSIVKIFNRLVIHGITNEIVTIGIVTWTIGIIFAWILSFTVVDFIFWSKSVCKCGWKRVWVGIIIFIYYITSSWFAEWFFCGNALRRITVPLILLLINHLINRYNWQSLVVLMLSFVSLISQTSTGFFFSAFIIYVCLLYYAYLREVGYLSKIACISLGPAVFMILYKPSTFILVVILYLTFLVLNMSKKLFIIEKIISKYVFIIIPAIPFIFGLISRMPFYTTPEFLIEGKTHPLTFAYGVENELVDNLLVFNLSSLENVLWTVFSITVIVCICYYCWKIFKESDKKNHIFAFFICTIVITFFNPWVINFVSKYFTGLVYFRIYDLIFNLLTIMIILLFTLNKIKNTGISILFIMWTAIIFVFHSFGITNYINKTNEKFSPMYHTSSIEIDLLDKFNKEYWINDEKPIKIAQQIYSPWVLTNENVEFLIDNFYDYTIDESTETQFQKIFFRNMPGVDPIKGDYLKVCELSKEREIDYFIIDAQYNNELENGLGYCADLLFEYENYRVFEAHYDWLEWSGLK